MDLTYDTLITILCAILAVVTSFFSIQNFLCQFLGSSGRRFQFEMDDVFGPLLGVPKIIPYSKIEGILLALGAFGAISCIIKNDQYSNFLSVVCILFAWIYFMLCLVYFYVAHDNNNGVYICGVFSLICGAIIHHRLTNYFDYEMYGTDLFYIGTGFVLVWAYFSKVMVLDNGPKNEMQVVIKKFQKIDRYCNEHPDFVWFHDKEQPEGMND